MPPIWLEKTDLLPSSPPSEPEMLDATTGPFVGLRPFDTREAVLFFGRLAQTLELLQELHRHRFVAVVGSSGCGKSSLVRAGLIPKLQAGFVAGDRSRWLVVTMKPGGSPLDKLLSSIAEAAGAGPYFEDPGKLLDKIRTEGLPALTGPLAHHLDTAEANLLLLVDQFEEVFHLVEEGAGDDARHEADEFVGLLLDLAAQRRIPVYVVLTMRSDFLGDCDKFPGLPEAMNRSQYLVPRLTRRQRQEAIEGPIHLFGASIAPRLVDRLLNDVGDQSDQLPVMEHALMRTWEHWSTHKAPTQPVDLDDYEKIGTAEKALDLDAELALEGLAPREVTVVERMFQAVTDTDPFNRRTGRRAALSRYFLTLEDARDDGDALLRLSHEALIRQWKRLRAWVDAEAESKKIYLRILDGARRYRDGRTKLLSRPEIKEAFKWWAGLDPNEAWARRYDPALDVAKDFLRKSRRRRRIKNFLIGLASMSAFPIRSRVHPLPGSRAPSRPGKGASAARIETGARCCRHAACPRQEPGGGTCREGKTR